MGCEGPWATGRERAYSWDAGRPFGDWLLCSACCINGNLTKKKKIFGGFFKYHKRIRKGAARIVLFC